MFAELNGSVCTLTLSRLLVSMATCVRFYSNMLVVGIYMFAAIGCPDQSKSKYVWQKRENNQMTAGCVHASDVTWTLVCIGTHWEGTSPNCSIGLIDSFCVF